MEETNVKEAIREIKEGNEEDLKKIIEKWYEHTHTDGLKLGAKMISAVIFDTIKKHTKKAAKVSLNDYKRMTNEIMSIIAIQLTEQNDSTEEVANDE